MTYQSLITFSPYKTVNVTSVASFIKMLQDEDYQSITIINQEKSEDSSAPFAIATSSDGTVTLIYLNELTNI